jgi:hypothetical protein
MGQTVQHDSIVNDQ